MNTLAFYSTGMNEKFKKPVTGISHWKNGYWYQDSEPTKKLITKLAAKMTPLEYLVIKPTGEMIKTENPLFIYGEQVVSLLQVNGEIVYNRYEKSDHVDSITNDFLFSSKTPF